MSRPRSKHGCIEGFIQQLDHSRGQIDGSGIAGHGSRHLHLGKLLKMPEAACSVRAGAADEQHRSAVEMGVHNSAERIDVRDAARDRTNPRLASQAAVALGDVSGGLLVPRVDQLEPRTMGSVVQRIKTVATQRCHPCDSALFQPLHQPFHSRLLHGFTVALLQSPFMMARYLFVLCLLQASLLGIDAKQLIAMSGGPSDLFRTALMETLGEENILKGTAFAGQGPDFMFAVEAGTRPTLFVDEKQVGPMRRVKGWKMWFLPARLETGRSHSFHYMVKDERYGGLQDIPAYRPECYVKDGVPQGKLSEKLVHTSKIYPGMTTEYWTYIPAQYDPKSPAALMVWQDGQNHTDRDGRARTLNVVDNLIDQKKIPVMILVFVAPGMTGDQRMRSIQYDTVDDTYPRFLREELLPEVYAKYNIRKDAYSRAIAGVSSGGICAFNAAWFQPDQFSRVLSIIGSFTSIQWKPGEREGGETYPFRVRKDNVRNIRVWLQDGAEDLENTHGSWPLQNIQLANSLKMKGYDFRLSWGSGTHNPAHGWSELPESLTWLWREYDPARTEQIFEIGPEEKSKPYFRVGISNR